MIRVQVDHAAFQSWIKQLESIGKKISNPDMQMARAKAFKKFVISSYRNGLLGMRPTSEATNKIKSIGDNKKAKNMIERMEVRELSPDAAEAGYFDGDKILGVNKKISMGRWAVLQHTGYKIPLTGKDGAAVRKYLAAFEIYPKKTTSFLHVPARPFLWKAYDMYIEGGHDIAAADKFLRRLGL